jgi:uncharacterized protein (DUF2267 family)
MLEAIQRESGWTLDRQAAERAAQAVLQTLAERLPPGEVRHVLQELPAELKPWVYTETHGRPFDIDEFLDRVAKREGTDVETALHHARAVFAVLGRALSAQEVAHLAANLPQTFEPLIAEAQNRLTNLEPADQFWSRVSQRLNVDQATARRVTEAVLETLAERIAAGQVEDLIAQLDPLLHPPLRRGLSSAGPDARRMPLREFLRRVAVREGASIDETVLWDQIFGHVRAVFATLAEAVSQKEWFDVTAELPYEYHALLPARSA